MVEVAEDLVHSLRSKLVDQSTPLSRQYRVLFSLRNIKGEAAREALENGVALVQMFRWGASPAHLFS
jgi:hypothetical protein